MFVISMLCLIMGAVMIVASARMAETHAESDTYIIEGDAVAIATFLVGMLLAVISLVIAGIELYKVLF